MPWCIAYEQSSLFPAPLAVSTLQDYGDRHIHYVDGLEIFGPEYVHLLPDELHPNAEGCRVMGENFVDKVAKQFFI